MYCLPGYVPLKDLEDRIFDIVMPDGVLAPQLTPSGLAKSASDSNSTDRVGWQIVADAMESFLGNDCATYATSPDGLCLRLSSDFAVSMIGVGLTESGRTDLEFRRGEPSFIFIQPDLYFLSTAKWENIEPTSWRRHVDELSLIEWQLLAKHVEKFEGWGMSIQESGLPNNIADLADDLPPVAIETKQENLCTPNAILTQFSKTPGITKNEMRELFSGVSIRRFNYVWSRAAEAEPQLSKPGRKPNTE